MPISELFEGAFKVENWARCLIGCAQGQNCRNPCGRWGEENLTLVMLGENPGSHFVLSLAREETDFFVCIDCVRFDVNSSQPSSPIPLLCDLVSEPGAAMASSDALKHARHLRRLPFADAARRLDAAFVQCRCDGP